MKKFAFFIISDCTSCSKQISYGKEHDTSHKTDCADRAQVIRYKE